MEDIHLAKLTYELVCRDLSLRQEDDFDLENLRDYLIGEIKQLLDHDMNSLLNAMYRIDLSEYKVKQILSTTPPDLLGATLADAIIEREKQKALTRLKFRS